MDNGPATRRGERSVTGETPGRSSVAASMAASRRWNRGCDGRPRERRVRPAPGAPAHPPAVTLANPGLTRGIRLAGTVTAGAIAAVLALGANGAAGSEPYYEISATGGKYDRGTDVSIELDAALPIPWTDEEGTALFLQPGAVLLDGPGGRRFYGASLGAVYRLQTAGGVAGVNAFYDRNWAGDSAGTRVHEQASVGVDYETGRHRLTANYYFPLSGASRWRVGATTLAEYAVGGPELRYRLDVNERWSVNARTRYERDPGLDGVMGRNAWRHAGGIEYRAGCLRLGAAIEHDTRLDETTPIVSVALRFGGSRATAACEEEPDRGLYALAEREKIVATRQVLVARQVKLLALTQLPDDVRELFEFVEGSDPNADTVWLYSDGGPLDSLEPPDFFGLYDGFENRHVVNVHQAQTWNPALFTDPRLNSIERIAVEMDVSVEILDRVIHHFKAQGKKVVVFSHSFGSFIVPRYLALKGPDAADRYVITAGRLDIEEVTFRNRLDKLHDNSPGVYIYPDGMTPTYVEPEGVTRTDLVGALFQGVLGMYRYTELLGGMDLSKVIYVHAELDQAVGRLTDSEVAFLESRNAQVIYVQNGGHGDVIDDPGARAEVLAALGE